MFIPVIRWWNNVLLLIYWPSAVKWALRYFPILVFKIAVSIWYFSLQTILRFWRAEVAFRLFLFFKFFYKLCILCCNYIDFVIVCVSRWSYLNGIIISVTNERYSTPFWEYAFLPRSVVAWNKCWYKPRVAILQMNYKWRLTSTKIDCCKRRHTLHVNISTPCMC